MPIVDPSASPASMPYTGVSFPVSRHQQPGSRTGYLGIADVVRIIRRRRWIIILVVIIALLATLTWLALTRPVYSAPATVMVQSAGAPAPDAATETATESAPTVTPAPAAETSILTKIALLQASSLAQETASSLQLAKDPEFAPANKGPGLLDRVFGFLTPAPPIGLDAQMKKSAAERARVEAVTDNLMSHLRVERVNHSNVITVTASSTDPVKAARIANRLVDVYIRDTIADANSIRAQRIAMLTNQVANVRTYLENSDATTAAYRRKHGLLNSEPESNGNAQVAGLASMLAQARGETAEATRKSAPAVMANGGISASSALLTDLKQQEAVLTRKQSQLGSFYGAGYPEVVQTSAELGALRDRIAEETVRVRADLRSQASASQARTGSLGSAMAGIRAQSFSDGQAAVPLRGLERSLDANKILYTSLLGQLNAKIGSPLTVNGDITRVSRASVPVVPSSPMAKPIVAVMALASILMGTLLAFVVEAMDTRLRTAEQVSRLLGIPTLAMVPEVQDEPGPVHEAVARRPRSRFAEAMRNLLIEVELRAGHHGSRVVMVTSPLEGEGKNTIATSLAAAAAVMGRQVVIVDFDLRRPGITSHDGDAADNAGVVAYLSDRAAVEDLVPNVARGRFAVIAVGEAAPDPGALIASKRLPLLLAQLRDRFELVILNAPPVLPVRDAKTLADNADATLMVLRWGRTSPEAAAAAIEIFDRPITGAVLNRVNYAVHAKRRYGDAIHHVAQSDSYYEWEAHPGRFAPLRRLSHSGRRALAHVAEALHLS